MSKKFFSLIQDGHVHLAPHTKIIPAAAFSTLMSAEDVLEKAQQDVEKYKMQVAAEGEQIKQKEYKAGFEKGYAEWIERIAALEEEIKKVRKDSENVILPIAMKAAKKILGRELELSKEAVVDIIETSLKAVATHTKIKLYVNKREFEILERHKERLKKVFERLESLSILTQEDIKPGGCLIETEGGIINAQLDNQWLILENAFHKLLKTNPMPGIQVKEDIPKQTIPAPARESAPASPPPKIASASTPAPQISENNDLEEEEDDWDDDDWDETEEEK